MFMACVSGKFLSVLVPVHSMPSRSLAFVVGRAYDHRVILPSNSFASFGMTGL
jgi:hypothetical protein